MRVEPCLCGGLISVPTEAASPAPYVEGHNFLPGHQAWRARKEGWHQTEVETRYDDPRRERPTAGLSPRDVSLETVRASASPLSGRS